MITFPCPTSSSSPVSALTLIGPKPNALWNNYSHQKRYHSKSIRIADIGYPYCRSFDEKLISDITIQDLKFVLLQGFRLLDSGVIIQISPSSREKAKSFLNSIYDYAIQHFYAKQNIARKFSIQQLKKEML